MKRIIMMTAFAVIFSFSGILHAQDRKDQKQNIHNQKEQQDFKSIDKDDIPDKVKEAFKKQFEQSEIDKAYLNDDDDVYKLELKNENRNENQTENIAKKEKETVFYKKDGTRVNIDSQEERKNSNKNNGNI